MQFHEIQYMRYMYLTCTKPGLAADCNQVVIPINYNEIITNLIDVFKARTFCMDPYGSLI